MKAPQMAVTRTQLSSRITLAVLGFLCASVLIFIFLGSRLFAYDMVRRLRNQHPELAVTPQPLTDSSVSAAEGMPLTRFGYRLEFPWKDLNVIRDLDGATLISFQSGRRVLLQGPKMQVDRVKTIRDRNSGSGSDPRGVLGEQTMASNYEFLKASFAIDPTQASLLTPTNAMIRTSILLLIKYGDSVDIEWGLFAVAGNGFRGFQLGSPSKGQNRTALQVFDNEDHEISIIISTSNPNTAPITQADVNRILQTLRRIDGTEHGADSPEHASRLRS